MCVVEAFKKCRNFEHRVHATVAWWADEPPGRPMRAERIRILREQEDLGDKERLIEEALRKLEAQRPAEPIEVKKDLFKKKPEAKKKTNRCQDTNWPALCKLFMGT